MLTEIGLLPVYNSMYSLGIKEDELEKIIIRNDKIQEIDSFKYGFKAGIAQIIIEPINYWDKKNVSLRKISDIKDKKDTMSYKILENSPCYFDANIKKHLNVFLDANKINITKFSKKEIACILAGINLVEAAQIKQGSIKFKSIQNLKNTAKIILINKFVTESIFNRFLPTTTTSINLDLLDFFEWVFDLNLDKKRNAIIKPLEKGTPYTHTIQRVFEKNNIRIAQCGCKYQNSSSYWRRNAEVTIKSYIISDINSKLYDFLDQDRRFYANLGNLENNNMRNCKYFPRLFLLDNNVPVPKKVDVYLDILNRNPGEEAFLVDSLTIENSIRRIEKRDLLKNKSKEQKETLVKKFQDKLAILNKTGTPININGTKIEKNSIEYAGQRIQCDNIETVDVVNRIGYYRNLDSLNFDTLSENFLNSICKKLEQNSYTNDYKISGKIGDIKFLIVNKSKENSAGYQSRNIYINNNKIKKDEIAEILKKGLCFDEQDKFDSFCKQVSKCSLKTHKYLNEGINIRVFDEFKKTKINFKIPLVRKNNKNYIILDNKKYAVSNTNRLTNLENASQMYEVINVLLNPKIVKIDGPSDIAFIIKKGEELHQLDKEKNIKLIERVENLFGLKVTEVINNGTKMRGYLIKGKLSNYFLDIGKTDMQSFFDRLRVFRYPDFNYVCMIDKGVQQTGPTHLINRIFALHNDSMIAKEVDTLNQNNINGK